MSAVTVTSADPARDLGAWLPALPGPGQPAADRQLAAVFREVQRRDPPGSTTADVHAQARAMTNGVYVAVRTTYFALSGASIVVSVRNTPTQSAPATAPQAKSLTASATAASESEWSPAPPDHPLAKLFRHINPLDTVTDYLAERSMCESLFGETVEWVIPTEDGTAPAELWNLRRNYLSELPMSPQYPRGGWRYAMPRPALGYAVAGTVLIPREQTLRHGSPNPLFPWAGYSPLAAGGKFVDFLNAVIDSRQQSMDHGFTPDMLVQMNGATEDQMAAFMAKVRSYAGGQNRGQRFFPVDGEKVAIVPVNTPPDKMMYPQGYDQGTAAVLALFGVPPSVAGLTESGSYSSFYAAARQFRETTLNHQVKRWGEFWTKHLAVPFFGDDVQVEVKLPPLQDPDLKDRQVGVVLGANGMSINRLLAIYDMPPVEWGDVTPAEFNLQLQQKYTPAPPPQPGTEGDPTGGEAAPDQAGEGERFGGVAGDDPDAPGDDAEGERPEVGAASGGSLPPAVRKGWLRKAKDKAGHEHGGDGRFTSGGGGGGHTKPAETDPAEREAFHRAMMADEEDHLPKLVYADYLDEHAHPLADLIRHDTARRQADGYDVNNYAYPLSEYAFGTVAGLHRESGVNYSVHSLTTPQHLPYRVDTDEDGHRVFVTEDGEASYERPHLPHTVTGERVVSAFLTNPDEAGHFSHPSAFESFHHRMSEDEVVNFFGRLNGEEGAEAARKYLARHPAGESPRREPRPPPPSAESKAFHPRDPKAYFDRLLAEVCQ